MVQNRLIIAIIIITAVLGIVALVLVPNTLQKMIIYSPSFNQGDEIPVQFTCDGGDINPELYIQDVPAEAASLVLIMEDPDAPTGIFTHWTVWNIDPKISVIPENVKVVEAFDSEISESRPRIVGREGETSFERNGYGGPCPPAGRPHRYFFKLYALDTVLDLDSNANVNELREAMNGHVIDKAELMGVYQR